MKRLCFSSSTSLRWSAATRPVCIDRLASCRTVQLGRPVRRRALVLSCTAAPTPKPPPQLRGLEGTGPLYALLAGAQAIPFVFPHSGVIGDISYFSITAVTALVLGCKRAMIDESGLEKALVSRTAAIAAPFAASGVLLTCYLLLKYTSIDISLILNSLTSLSAAVFLKESCDPLIVALFDKLGIENKRSENQPAPSEWVTGIISFAVTAGYLSTKSFVLSNALALGIVARVLGLVRLESFVVAVR